MPKEKSILDPEVTASKIIDFKKSFVDFLLRHKKLVIGLIVLVIVILSATVILRKGSTPKTAASISQTVNVDKGYDFKALSNQGSPLTSKVKLTVTKAEKTNQVIVKDQAFVAKNHKLFLILNFNLKNDTTTQVNIVPGDLFRLTYNGDEDNKYAPDLHNNLVPIAAVSTKPDRIGFVVPEDVKQFKIYIGELDGTKDTFLVKFPS